MADQITIKAPELEQNVVVNIQGEEKLRNFAKTLNRMAEGTNLQDYWKSQKTLIDDVTKKRSKNIRKLHLKVMLKN